MLPKDWDQPTQTVRPRATLGGETAAIVNGDLAKTLNKAYSIIADLIANELPPTFDAFKPKMGAEKKSAFRFFDAAVKLLDEEYAGKQISDSTLKVYKVSLNKFFPPIQIPRRKPKTRIRQISRIHLQQRNKRQVLLPMQPHRTPHREQAHNFRHIPRPGAVVVDAPRGHQHIAGAFKIPVPVAVDRNGHRIPGNFRSTRLSPDC